MRNVYNILMKSPGGTIPFGRHRSKSEINVKLNFKELASEGLVLKSRNNTIMYIMKQLRKTVIMFHNQSRTAFGK
jgi:hypothetical protein